VGEIRDKETAEIAMKASQTGHMVLSTLHTNDSISTVTRLLDLDIAGYMVAASVTGVIAQRLVRRLCSCHKETPATAAFAARMAKIGATELPCSERVAVGCEVCDQTGYKGRVGIYELLVFDEAIRNAVRTSGRPDEIRHLARIAGMRLMQQNALERVKSGSTTLEEVLRVVPFETITTLVCSSCGGELAPSFSFCPHCSAAHDQNRTSRHTGSHKRPEPAPAGVLHTK
jgi:type II secretory ATPase GspE/PulE/Tfp pilus assembly ATPase PilB-like protein